MTHNGSVPTVGPDDRGAQPAPVDPRPPSGGLAAPGQSAWITAGVPSTASGAAIANAASSGALSSRTIGNRYRMDRVLGKGSMGTVWAAYDELLHRRVAIKEIYVPDGTPRADADMLVERTLREARAIAQLSHPNVITLYDILTLDTGPVIVMEVLAARSLGEVLKEVGTLTVGQAATVGLAVAAGLNAAHAAGITHRDVKPGNVLIGGDGRIKLTDFGIARSAAENPMTATGLLLGSPAYIAPEVASGETAGPAADAWGLGALLFAAVEGRPPFDKKAPVATLMSVVNDPIPQLEHAGALSPVIKGLMVKDPAHRLNLRQARAAMRPLADDPVETRLVFGSPHVTATSISTLGGPASRPPWVDQAPPRTPPPPPRTTVMPLPSSTSAGRATLGPHSVAARSLTGQHPPGATLPPPPWAALGAQQLAALPNRGTMGGYPTPPQPLPAIRDQVWPNRATRRWIAVVAFLVGVAVAFFGIRAIATTVTEKLENSAPVSSVIVSTPVGELALY
jgi:eukaryotic-like serine/threonine-protein kinase